jgi:branched-chain amino acid transport system ATP-binding protein
MMLAPRVIELPEPKAGLSASLAKVARPDQARMLADSGTAVLPVEQKAHAALETPDWAYVLVSGRVATSAPGRQAPDDPDIGEDSLGGGSSLRGDAPATR